MKLILNEGQSLLRINIELKILTENNEIDDTNTNVHNLNLKIEILSYLKTRKDNNTLNQIDKLLLYLNFNVKCRKCMACRLII